MDGVTLDPERLPVLSSDSEENSDEDNILGDEGENLLQRDVGDRDLDEEYDSNYTEDEDNDSNSLNSEGEENDDVDDNGVDDGGGNYIVRGVGDAEYLLPLDEMNEEELQQLLEELEMSAASGWPPAASAGYQLASDHHSLSSSPQEPTEQQKFEHHSSGSIDISNSQAGIVPPAAAPNSSKNELYPSLSVLEMTFYFCAFWMGAGYSLYRFYKTSQRWKTYLPLSATPESIWGRHRDDTDIEWFVWPALLLPHAHYAALHAVIATLVRRHAHKHLCLFYITSSVYVIYRVVGSVGLILCLTVPSLIFTVLLTRNKQLLWGAWCLILLLFNVDPVTSTLEQFMSAIPEGDYKVSVMVAWIILRSLSYSLETCDADPDNNLPLTRQLLTLFAYCLYLPFLFTGPYMPYVDFMTGLNAAYRPWTLRRVMQLMLQLLRFSIWATLASFLLYHFYAHALHWSPQLVVRLNSWSMAGFVYFLLMFFLIKYVVLYGFPGAIASIEGYKAPPPPKCVLILCRFSQLWRDFDFGLYMFMKQHIYLPWVTNAGRGYVSKLQATALVFTFVYVWHGVTPQVMLWSGINFLGVLVEKSADAIATKPWYKSWENRWLSPRMRRRFYGLLSMLLLVPSVTSLTIFLTSLENSSYVGYRIFVEGFPQVTFTMMFFMYCIAQNSFEVHNWKVRRGDKAMKLK